MFRCPPTWNHAHMQDTWFSSELDDVRVMLMMMAVCNCVRFESWRSGETQILVLRGLLRQNSPLKSFDSTTYTGSQVSGCIVYQSLWFRARCPIKLVSRHLFPSGLGVWAITGVSPDSWTRNFENGRKEITAVFFGFFSGESSSSAHSPYVLFPLASVFRPVCRLPFFILGAQYKYRTSGSVTPRTFSVVIYP